MEKRYVLGIDIGGTSLKWGLAEVNADGSVGAMIALNEGAEDKRYTRAKDTYLKGKPETESLAFLAKTYREILAEAQDIAAQNGAILAGVGIGSPGRFITPQEYEEHYCGPNRTTPHERLGRDAQLLQKEFGRSPYDKTQAKGGDDRVVAPGSNPNMAKKVDANGTSYSQLDGVALAAFLQGMTPVKVRVENDAAVQMRAIMGGLDEAVAKALKGKKAIYLGFGTGVGAAVMDGAGNIVTDGHFQHTKLPRREGDDAAYDAICGFAVADGKLTTDRGDAPSAEMMFAASNINRLMQLPFEAEFPPIADDLSEDERKKEETRRLRECERRMLECAPGDDAAQRSHAYLESVGRYMADYLANVHEGRFEHRDPNAAWSAADHDAIRGYEAVAFGGAMATSRMFADVIIASMKEELADKGINLVEATEKAPEGAGHVIRYVRSTQQTTEQTIRAGMALLDAETLLLPPEKMAMERAGRAAVRG